MKSGIAFVVALLLSAGAQAWSNHALCTWPALSVLPEVTTHAPVKVETLASFLDADPAGLAKLLRDEEDWTRAHVSGYPARPDALAFDAGGSSDITARFLAALRVNPNVRLALYLQLPPGRAPGARTVLAENQVTIMKTTESTKQNVFVALQGGELVPVIDVLASAVDEPDYGLDIGLWADNGTPFGARYGFGRQPFGNPAIEWSSQAPMHMGFFHESGIVYKAAPYLQRTFPEYRIHLWHSLAAFALRSGHDYWGWRFAGWGLHYLQDLTQPYHADVLPGVSLARMLGINALDLAGLHGPKDRMIQLVTNRHLVLEEFERQWMRAVYAQGFDTDRGVLALRDTSRDAQAGPYKDTWPREVVSLRSNAAADALDAALARGFPPRYTQDPAYIFGVTDVGLDVYAELGKSSPAGREAMKQAVVPLLADLGLVSRAYTRSLIKTGSATAH